MGSGVQGEPCTKGPRMFSFVSGEPCTKGQRGDLNVTFLLKRILSLRRDSIRKILLPITKLYQQFFKNPLINAGKGVKFVNIDTFIDFMDRRVERPELNHLCAGGSDKASI